MNITLTIKADPALQNFLDALVGKLVANEIPTLVPQPQAAAKKPQPKAEQKPEVKAEPAATEAIQPAAGVSSASAFIESLAEDADITQEQLRELLIAKNKAGYKNANKAKLTELGTENLTNLDKKHYATFYNHLNALS